MLLACKHCLSTTHQACPLATGFHQIMAYSSSSVKVPEFKGKAFRKLKLHEMGPDVLEGMDLLEERRAQKWIKESEERSKRRLQGIMYDEDVLEGGQKIRYLYEREFKQLNSLDKETHMLWWTIIGSIFFGACAFIFVRMRLVKKRRQLMLERKARSLEERKRRERLAREQAGLKLAQ